MSQKKISIKIDQDKCIGCGLCTTLAPRTFELNSQNKARVKKQPGDDLKTILEATQNCPVQAITVKH